MAAAVNTWCSSPYFLCKFCPPGSCVQNSLQQQVKFLYCKWNAELEFCELCTLALNKSKDSDLGVCVGEEENDFLFTQLMQVADALM